MFFKKTKVVKEDQEKLLRFPKIDVLEHRIDQVNDALNLKRAFFKENLNRTKLKIFFTDHSGLQKVETSVWTISEKAIILKNNTVVPLSDIVAVA
ncbi:hypothetical protein [uncultured Tenacibaculum sp.]|uniref:hypothetical protein n=1 Tax=uncultured Tenacibaculum sp. TaxID=174713 RepID=UPI00260E026B|nr:hypothetical protein [uncultured Tenacibaculum sp.]